MLDTMPVIFYLEIFIECSQLHFEVGIVLFIYLI